MANPASAQRQEIFRSCERFLAGNGRRSAASELAALAASAGDQPLDMYGSGGALEELEQDIATLLGKPAAVFMPSGTMAQQIAMRLHAEDTGRRTLAFHPTCHLELHEQRGYASLHALEARLVGARQRLIDLPDLEAIQEPIAALLLELPQREIGGLLPSWQQLQVQIAWARDRAIPVHMDGARLWQSAPFYARSYAEIAAGFDSVYVSFYKALGAIAGAALAGSETFVERARVWQRRHGGTLVTLYPYVLSAREGLRTRLARMPDYVRDARRVAALINELHGVHVTPQPPHTNMFHAFFPLDPERLLDASATLAQDRHVALFTRTRPCDVPGYCAVEVSIGDAASELEDTELRQMLAELVDRAG